ncbi:hypothetical protein IHE49_08405 [Rhodanobacter sp. 7MK24]|uniref:hypothetical protein n=1 Tax=Rhodanobacter sp. 7MK24 TaxID=2775922 RepID=UPI00177AE550|nr:hypothetical protein [Rhodanobacter sp. 7MK24]
MIIVFLASLVLIALCILWLPAWSAALLLRRMGVPQPHRVLRVVMPSQLLVAAALIWAADATGLTNPAGYSLAILLLTGIAGAAIVWRQRRGNV